MRYYTQHEKLYATTDFHPIGEFKKPMLAQQIATNLNHIEALKALKNLHQQAEITIMEYCQGIEKVLKELEL